MFSYFSIYFLFLVSLVAVDMLWLLVICRIPDDCIDSKRYPLFMAREVMRQLIDNLCVTTAVHPGALS